MGTLSTNTHSQGTRDSFQTVNEYISSDALTLSSTWKYHPKGVYEALNTDVRLDSNKEAVRKQIVKIMSRYVSHDLHILL
jgi:hypothetical protein